MRTGSLAIAASQTIGTYWLPRVIKTFAARCPGIGVTLELGNTEFVAERIRDGAAVLGFIEGPIDEPALAVEALFMDELALVTAPDDNWFAGGGPIEDRLRSARWIVRENGSGTRIALENALRAYGILPEDMIVALELPSNEAVRTAVEAGVGVTVLSRMAVDCALRAGMLAECRIRLAGRGFFALRHRERHQGRAAALFVDLARGGPFLCPAH
jgi:DNA-binding transcriptional LysR family regulator